MSTGAPDAALSAALGAIPTSFRSRLIATYKSIRAAALSGDADAAGLRGGIFCEVLLRFLQEQLTSTHIPFGTKIGNLADECRRLEQLPQTAGHESLRVIMPRALLVLYTLRNKRGIGHVGGDVDANLIDAATCVRIADWCICELIRLFHSISLEEAQAILDAISVRQIPGIWSVGGKRRVLDHSLGYKEQTLLLLYGEQESAVPVEDVFDWVEHPRMDNFRDRILKPLHQQRLIEWDRENRTLAISPTGARLVEEQLLKGSSE